MPEKRAVVVEDDPGLRALYRTAFSAAGYAVTAVEDGLDALRQIENHAVPDAVVLDLQLPRLSGRDLRQELKAQSLTRGIPVVVVTGTETDDLNPSDFAYILRKPIHPEVIVRAVDNCLRRPPRRAIQNM